MSQNCVMKQLIHSAASYHPRLQSLKYCQAFIVPSPQMKPRKKLKPYSTLHCGPDIIISLVCGLSQGTLFIQECALDKTYRPLKTLFSGFRTLSGVKCSPLALLPPKLFSLSRSWAAPEPRSTPHAPAKTQCSVKPRGINFTPITRN